MNSVVVLVLAWNGRDFLPACLRALLAQAYDGRHAVLVVDNASVDDSVELVRRDFPTVALLTNVRNLGFAGGNNAGLRALLAGRAPAPIDFIPDLIVLLNQDTEVEPGWLRGMAEVFGRHARAGVVGCKIFFPDGTTLQHAGGQVIAPLATGRHRGTGEADAGQYDVEEPVEYVTGAAMAVHRRVFEAIGLLDEGFTPAYYEDGDFCYRARAAGFEVIYTPAARLRHYENASLQGQSPAHQRAYHRNRIRFVLKHSTLDEITQSFVPAEREEIGRWSIADSLARKHAYVDGLLDLPALLPQRRDGPNARAARDQLIAVLRHLHHTIVEEERERRAEAGYRLRADRRWRDDVAADAPECAEQPISEEVIMTIPEPSEQTTTDELVDIAAIMRQVRRQISERRVLQDTGALAQALDQLNEQWDKVYEPLHLAPARAVLGRAWDVVRARLHNEVRSYLDPMVYRQTELNANIVRVLNQLSQRSRTPSDADEIEALRDEVMQLREQVRQLEELVQQRHDR
jgi:GT2 family glycosyltransferase